MITLTYLSHSSFLVTCGATRLIFDPWLKGPAYHKQWFLWPLPAAQAIDLKADAILISHGHEDHMHPESLKAMDKEARVFFPFQWRDGVAKFLKHLGYKKVTEAVTFQTYPVNDVKITYISFSLESVIVIEYGNEVLININDALNSNHENAVAFILKEINARWKNPDYLLSGWSGASYFPNQVKYPGKNDLEIGRIREQYFADNFCKFTRAIQPKYAIPFCPGFVLLKPENLWINTVKFPRKKVEAYYREFFEPGDTISFLCPYPEDSIENGVLQKRSYLHDVSEEDQPAMAYRHYEKEMQTATEITIVPEAKIQTLIEQLRHWMNYNKRLYDTKVLKDSEFSILLEDTQPQVYLNIHFGKDNAFNIDKSDAPMDQRRLLITTSAERLAIGLAKVWGGDVLTIGYGLTIEMYDQQSLEKNLDIVCVRLITRYPIARADLLKYPVRALKFYALNPKITTLWLRQKVELKPYVNKYPYNERDHWLSYNKCDLCAVCKMPEINLEGY